MANTQTTVPLFVSNQVLTASQQNLSAGTGVPVFATTVTRDAAFGGSNKALAEGQLAYIEASNIVQYYDGAAWATVGPATASGFVAITPTSVSVGSGTATVGATGLITFTTVGTNLSINGCFSATYNNYKAMFVTTNASANTMTARLRVAGTDSSATNYWTNWLYGNAATAFQESAYSTSWNLAITSKTSRTFSADFLDPFKASPTSLLGNGNENNAGTNGGGFSFAHQNTASTSYDGFSLIPNTSTMTGTLMIYGYN